MRQTKRPPGANGTNGATGAAQVRRGKARAQPERVAAAGLDKGHAAGDSLTRRERMVSTQLVDRGIRSQAVLQAMCTVPRERFVSAAFQDQAYNDSPLPIGEGQTISQPYVVAVMIEAAQVGPDDRVLEVGAGSGYAAAVLSHLAAQVVAIERNAALAASACERLAALGCRNVEVVAGDGTRGCTDGRRFNAILVAAAGPDVPPALKMQLADGGRLVMPVGGREVQHLVKVTRNGNDFEQEVIARVSFVPLVGEQGWAEAVRPARPDESGAR